MNSIKDIAKSVAQRLKNHAKREGRTFEELSIYYGMERFLYRLSQSKHANMFILKGAVMLRVWNSQDPRATRDIDLLGKTSNDPESIIGKILEILSTEVEPDGIIFDPDSIQYEPITEGANYTGIRIRFLSKIDTAKVPMLIDIGFGDVVSPHPTKEDYPTLLEFPAPNILCYSRESSIAEKVEAVIKLGSINSRMKDFYDIWMLSRQFNFDEKTLTKAIHATLGHRKTAIPNTIEAFSEDFAETKQKDWTAFCNNLKLEKRIAPKSFSEVIAVIRAFIGPLLVEPSLSNKKSKSITWVAPSGWR